MKGSLIWAFVGVLLVSLASTEGCTCATAPETTCAKLAKTPIVVKARINSATKKGINKIWNRVIYRVTVLEVFSGEGLKKNTRISLKTNYDRTACGVPGLKKNDLIVTSLQEKFDEDNEYTMSACNYQVAWKKATDTDRSLLRKLKEERSVGRCGCIDPSGSGTEVLDGWEGPGKEENETCRCDEGVVTCTTKGPGTFEPVETK